MSYKLLLLAAITSLITNVYAEAPINGMTDASLKGIYCDENAFSCVSVGKSKGIKDFHLIYSTKDGKNWKKNKISTTNFSHMQSVSCDFNNLLCSAVGVQFLNGSENIAFTSKDAGDTWSSTANILPNENDPYPHQLLNSVYCSILTHRCVAVGFAVESLIKYPLIISSDDYGQSWKIEQKRIIRGKPNSEFNTVHCDKEGFNCVAFGITQADMSYIPISYITENGGLNWHPSHTQPQIPQDFLKKFYADAKISSISCDTSGKICIAVGGYRSPDHPRLPLIYTTHTGGEDWEQVIVSNYPADNREINTLIDLSSVTCNPNATRCIAVGGYVSQKDKFLPVAYISEDSGKNWKVSQPLELPSDAALNDEDAIINNKTPLESISCSNDTLSCFAVGQYMPKNKISMLSYSPIIYGTQDGGVTWQLQKIGAS